MKLNIVNFLGVLAVAAFAGNVDAVVFSKQHVISDNTIALMQEGGKVAVNMANSIKDVFGFCERGGEDTQTTIGFSSIELTRENFNECNKNGLCLNLIDENGHLAWETFTIGDERGGYQLNNREDFENASVYFRYTENANDFGNTKLERGNPVRNRIIGIVRRKLFPRG